MAVRVTAGPRVSRGRYDPSTPAGVGYFQPVIARTTPWPVTLCCTLMYRIEPLASKMPPVSSALRSFSEAIRTQPSLSRLSSVPSGRQLNRSLFPCSWSPSSPGWSPGCTGRPLC